MSPQIKWRKGRPARFAANCRRLGLDWRGAVIFRNKIVAEASDGSLWQLATPRLSGNGTPSMRWLPLVALDICHNSTSKHPIKDRRPQQERADEKRDRGKRSRLSGNMTEHGADSGSRNHHAAGKSFQSR